MNRRLVTEALRDFIVTHTGTACGIAQRPPDVPERTAEVQTAYAVIYPLHGANWIGDLADPESSVHWEYQVTCTGRRHDQAQWLDDRIREELLKRVGSRFEHELVAADCTVIDRTALDSGGNVPSDGTVHAVQSTYRLSVEKLA